MLDSDVSTKLLDALPAVEHAQIALLRDLIGCRTVSATKPSPEFTQEAERARDRLLEELAHLGCDSETWLVDGGFPVIRATTRHDPGSPTIGFNGHFDVVPIEDPAKWRHAPWAGEREGSRLYGRGACDAKGSIVAMLGAMRLLRAAEVPLAARLMLDLVSDEEVAGACTDACLDRGLPDAVIVGEPSFPEVWIAEPGLEHVRIEIEGVATHALNRWRALEAPAGDDSGGVNAIDKALAVAAAVQEIERDWTASQAYPLLPAKFNTINLGTVFGGKSQAPGEVNLAVGPGSVPDYCALEYNIWYYPHQPLESLRDEFEARVRASVAGDRWLEAHPPRFTWALHGLSNPPAVTDPSHPLAQALVESARAQDREARPTAMQGASLLPWYTRRGVPGVIFGPGSVAQAHGVDEFIDLGSLRSATLALAGALADPGLQEVPTLAR